MAMKYFCCYHSYREILAGLTDEQFGKLFRAALLYSETGEMPGLPPAESIAFSFIRRDIDQASEEYERKCETNRANANRRKQTQAAASDGIRPQATAADGKPTETAGAKEKEKEKENVNEKMIDDDSGDAARSDPSSINSSQEETVFRSYCQLCPSLQTVSRLTPKRRDAVRELLTQYTTEEIAEGFRKAEATPYLCGRVNGHPADFDWLIQPDNFTKLLEGKYDERHDPASKYEVVMPF